MSAEQVLAPAALEEPMVPVRRGYIGAVALVNLGITIAFFTPIQSLLPRLAQEVAPDSKETALAWIAGAGAFASIFFNPLAGALSDRTTSRWGRRKPWVLGGALVGAVGIVFLGVPGTVLGLSLVWFACQACHKRVLRGRHRDHPRPGPGPAAGTRLRLGGLAPTVGVVVGVALVSFVVTDLRPGLVLTAVLLVLLVLPFVVGVRDVVLPQELRRRSTWVPGCVGSGSPRACTPTSRGRGSPASS